MFSCRSCLWHHVLALLENPALYQIGQRSAVSLRYAPGGIRRSYRATSKYRYGNQPQSEAHCKIPPTAVAIQKQLVYLKDPLKLAGYVVDRLKEGKFPEAISLVRTASKNLPCTVSWNHLLNWQLSQGDINGAIKMYNEMKKRGQQPDAYTFTIIFRGMAEFPHHTQTLPKALSIYHSMDAENSPVKPNTIHTNAILKVCARAKDMDALLGVVAKLGRKGLRAPNNLTYTTILNAIRHQAKEPDRMLDKAELRAVYQKAIMNARNLWVDIIDRWRRGDIWIDEELTCSMGRILLMGESGDVDDVFSLIEQTMNISRLAPPVDEERGNLTTHWKEEAGSVSLKTKSPPAGDSTLFDSTTKDMVLHSEFRVVEPPKSVSEERSGYAQPGRNSLSLVLEALLATRLKRPLRAYWDVFTDTHKVVPDSRNFHDYLRNLRMRRASSDVIKVLLQMPKEMLEKKTFRIAISACARDINNESCFSNAGKVLDLMQQSISDLDLPTLHKYMEIALYGKLYSDAPSASGDSNEEQFARGRQVLRALDRLGPCVINIRSAMAYSEPPSKTNSVSRDRKAAIALVREMIGAYDKLINKGMVAPGMNRDLKRERIKLAAFVTRSQHKMLDSKHRHRSKEGARA